MYLDCRCNVLNGQYRLYGISVDAVELVHFREVQARHSDNDLSRTLETADHDLFEDRTRWAEGARVSTRQVEETQSVKFASVGR